MMYTLLIGLDHFTSLDILQEVKEPAENVEQKLKTYQEVNMPEWLKEAIENYDNLTESQQAHVDAALDYMSEENESF